MSSDIDRLVVLKALRDMPDLDPQFHRDVQRLVTHAEAWTRGEGNWLTNFTRPIRATNDYDFGIAVDSPLWPLVCVYRSRMLWWGTNQAFRGDTDEVALRAREAFETALAAFPDNRVLRMYQGEMIPAPKTYQSVDGAPEWASYQREGLERLADIVEWWIDYRQQPSGVYGGGWGDDCEMWRFWVPVLVAFHDPKIAAAQERLSRGLLELPYMREGFNDRVLFDVQHNAEDTADTITPMMFLEPHSPEWSRRARRLTELMETLWMGRNHRGGLQFKSTYFKATAVDDNPQRACDTPYHVRTAQPTLLLWQRTADQDLGRLFTDWMNTWVEATARQERGKPAGIIPAALHWPEGTIGGVGPDWWDPRNHSESRLYRWPNAMVYLTNTLLLTYHMTGDEKYLEPIHSMAAIRREYRHLDRRDATQPGSAAWCAQRMGFLLQTLAKYRLLTGDPQYDDLLGETQSYLTYRTSGEIGPLVDSLRALTELFRVNFEGFTSEVRWTDRALNFRISPETGRPFIGGRHDVSVLYSSATGDPADAGYFPMNAVRWLTPPRQIAALVTQSAHDVFEARLYHFGTTQRSITAELYLLKNGTYRVTLEPAAGRVSQEIRVTGPITRVSFDLPPQTECTLLIQTVQTDNTATP